MSRLLFICIAFFMSLNVSNAANRFVNQFISFELPANWQCNLEGAEWVCQNVDKKSSRDAIIIMAAKLKGNQDSLDQYLEHLQKPKTYRSVNNRPVQSEPKFARYKKINGHTWVDSLHLESEIPGFYTRYLATVKEDIGVLVTYSVNKSSHSQYLDEFEAMVKTLQVFRKPGLNALPKNTNLFQGGTANGNLGNAPPPTHIFDTKPIDAHSGGQAGMRGKSGLDTTTLIIIILIAGAAFIIWKKKRG